MKKIMLLLMIASGWWHNADCQSDTGAELYYYMDNNTVSLSPKAWYQSNSGWYTEARYNFEAAKTLSVCMGKTFEHKAAVSYALTPLAGIVTGQFNGGAIAENATIEYRKILFSLQSQYTFSIENKAQNFMYSWADLSYGLFTGFSAGVSFQQTNLYNTKSKSAKGFFFRGGAGKWEFPVYVFNIHNNQRQLVLGLTYTNR